MTPSDTQPPFRTGVGYDIHRLVPDRPLVLGGVRFDSPVGLDGHSDADVVLHAVADAVLGAAALGDIGHHFPPDDVRWAGADSRELLRSVNDLLREAGWNVGNIDVTVIAEAPKVNPRAPEMCQHIAEALGIVPGQVSLKATTNEMLGALGRREGVAALATAMIWRSREGPA